ncbi:MAG TPA: hypothetical protein VKA00_08155 [Trueperaceae bacterium]|nr:hypothetical protein [Trueperaceae bacterium]
MAAEVCSYRLTHKGKPVGNHELKVQRGSRVTLLEGRALFQGALGTSTVIQRSRCRGEADGPAAVSLRFREETNERSGQRTFDLVFDAEQGVVTGSRGREEATAPYLMPYRDPLSLLFELRSLGRADRAEEHVVVPMLGKDVTVQSAGEVELDTPLGIKTAWAYRLHPGGSAVYVDREPPHLLLKMTQRLADGYVDAVLVKIAQEGDLEDWGAPGGGPRGQGGKRRRRSRRRKPRRGKRNNG